MVPIAEPISTSVVIVKAVVSQVLSEKGRGRIGKIILLIIAILVVLCSVIGGIGTGMAEHNKKVLDLTFHGGFIPLTMPGEFKEHIRAMRDCFDRIESESSAVQAEMEEGDTLDIIRIKSVFYALYFGQDNPGAVDISAFIQCFVAKEERTREVEVDSGEVDENGDPIMETEEETYEVYVSIKDMSQVYQNIAATMGRAVTSDDQINIQEIYYRIAYKDIPDYGEDFVDWSNGLPLSEEPFVGMDGFTVPVGGDWRSIVSSEFGPRPSFKDDPNHTGIDFKQPTGSSIYAALDGTVLYVRYSKKGFGYHFAIDHGGGIITLYAHCSAIYVTEGQKVTAGQHIAAIGSTGLSTGPHLHFEIRENGTPVNPRKYLP